MMAFERPGTAVPASVSTSTSANCASAEPPPSKMAADAAMTVLKRIEFSAAAVQEPTAADAFPQAVLMSLVGYACSGLIFFGPGNVDACNVHLAPDLWEARADRRDRESPAQSGGER